MFSNPIDISFPWLFIVHSFRFSENGNFLISTIINLNIRSQVVLVQFRMLNGMICLLHRHGMLFLSILNFNAPLELQCKFYFHLFARARINRYIHLMFSSRNAGQRDYNEEPDYNEDRDWNSHRRLGKPRDFNEERDWDNHRRFSAPCPNNDRYDQPSASNWNTETRSRDPREQQPSYGVAQPSPPQRFWAPTPQNLSPGMFSYPPPSPAMMPPGFPAPSFAPSPAYAYGRQGEFDHANRHHQHDAGPSSLHQPPPAQNFRDVRAMPSTLLPYEGHRRRTREDDYLDDGPTFSREPRWEAPSSRYVREFSAFGCSFVISHLALVNFLIAYFYVWQYVCTVYICVL